MVMRIVFLASLVPLALCQAAPAIAASPVEIPKSAEQSEGYDRLYDALVSDPDGSGARRLAEITVGVMNVQTPEHLEIEAENPGFLADLQRSLMPVVTAYMARNRDIHRDDFMEAVRPLLTEGQALEVAVFYESELGDTLLRASRGNYLIELTSEELAETEDLTREDAERSVEATSTAATAAVSESDLDRVDAYLSANPGLMQSIELLREPMLDIRVSMDNETLNDAEEDQFRQIYADVLARYGR